MLISKRLFYKRGPRQLSRYGYSLRAERSGDRIPVGRNFPHQSRTTLGPTQPPIQWVRGHCPGDKTARGVTLTTHPI